ncbi:NUDIX domain-containing protein [Candidatus Parcubacteria bacterium]|uniref:8-oxo-dGTP diphosphatase n=1 Tax=Candidatus Kaiserbacteria bacterium CG10_big_fil_rev_8_21_14_0_10_47_16 TaxID=1974608 RepID=A0A2H0UEB1_9BACT|nr:NUDIX domain-containing protein [Candidatus Parcubacteria bacterium]PIR84749.1 MAG: hypothetical protein COU16_01005 [Candidatus Kaiserbacteria bacterium CG10_big_fil_rev_8_21_14_0_10_47_16]
MSKKEIAIIFIQDSDGKFFVHQRLASKKVFPNRYGIGAGGHVDEGETPEEAAVRELEEETGLTLPVTYLFTQDFDTPEINQISHLFITTTDEDIAIDESEWQWSGWLRKGELDALCDEGKLCTDTEFFYRKLREGN